MISVARCERPATNFSSGANRQPGWDADKPIVGTINAA